jgi:hypothetical protein
MEEYNSPLTPEEEPQPEAVPISIRLRRLTGLLAPGQRLILSIFLFLDVCVLCFAFLFLFKKIGFPF